MAALKSGEPRSWLGYATSLPQSLKQNVHILMTVTLDKNDSGNKWFSPSSVSGYNTTCSVQRSECSVIVEDKTGFLKL